MSFGICSLALVPVRNEASDRSEMVSQLLFGQIYEVIHQGVDWFKIRIEDDGYDGYICAKQHCCLKRDTLHLDSCRVLSTEISIQSTKGLSQVLPRGAKLWNLKGSVFGWGDEDFEAIGGSDEDFKASEDFNQIEQYSRLMLGAPYLWGGKSIFGIDCSGFTQLIMSLCGINLKRDASQQVNQGVAVPTLDESKTGDLVFFNNDKGKVTHVGIVLRENDGLRVVHASGKVRIDLLNELGILSIDRGILTHNFHSIRRFVS